MKKIILILLTAFVMSHCMSQTSSDAVAKENLDGFKNTGWQSLKENPIKMIGTDWMLITAGNIESFNMMTASWGGMGWLWEKPVAFIFVRPQRYTHEFIEKGDFFTLTFFEENYREILLKMGTASGREINKMKDSGLQAITTKAGNVAFKEAKIVIECKKIYTTSIMEEGFVDKDIMKKMYPENDFHTMYVGEIVNVWMR